MKRGSLRCCPEYTTLISTADLHISPRRLAYQLRDRLDFAHSQVVIIWYQPPVRDLFVGTKL